MAVHRTSNLDTHSPHRPMRLFSSAMVTVVMAKEMNMSACASSSYGAKDPPAMRTLKRISGISVAATASTIFSAKMHGCCRRWSFSIVIPLRSVTIPPPCQDHRDPTDSAVEHGGLEAWRKPSNDKPRKLFTSHSSFVQNVSTNPVCGWVCGDVTFAFAAVVTFTIFLTRYQGP